MGQHMCVCFVFMSGYVLCPAYVLCENESSSVLVCIIVCLSALFCECVHTLSMLGEVFSWFSFPRVDAYVWRVMHLFECQHR